MDYRETNRATFVEVLGSIKFDRKQTRNASGQRSREGFAVNQSTHQGEAAPDDYKQLVRSSN